MCPLPIEWARESRGRLWSRDRHYYKCDLRAVVSEARRIKELAYALISRRIGTYTGDGFRLSDRPLASPK